MRLEGSKITSMNQDKLRQVMAASTALSAQERQVLQLRFGLIDDGRCWLLRELGQELGVGMARISHLISRSMQKLGLKKMKPPKVKYMAFYRVSQFPKSEYLDLSRLVNRDMMRLINWQLVKARRADCMSLDALYEAAICNRRTCPLGWSQCWEVARAQGGAGRDKYNCHLYEILRTVESLRRENHEHTKTGH